MLQRGFTLKKKKIEKLLLQLSFMIGSRGRRKILNKKHERIANCRHTFGCKEKKTF